MVFYEDRHMKQAIHPEYKEAVYKCACGATYETRSTRGDLSIEICAACHPFYTGDQRVVDAAGRVDRFKRKYKMK